MSESASAAPFYFVLGARSGPANQSEARASPLTAIEAVSHSEVLTSSENCGKFEGLKDLCSVQICGFLFRSLKKAPKCQRLNYIHTNQSCFYFSFNGQIT